MSESLSPRRVHSNATIDTLPAPVTPLLGRNREVAAVRAMLDADDTRLVTVTGAGGIGKTRLALEIARTMADDFAHGARFVPLASVRDADLAPLTVAQAFGVRPQGGLPVVEVLTELLRDRHLLLVLDNLEHLIHGLAPWVADLLTRCTRLHVLATSRVSLRIAGEQRYPLEPLALPERSPGAAFERIAQSSAVQLFVQRARAARPDLALDAPAAEDIAGICRAVEGVPLAIELAAARVSSMSLPSLRERLASRLPLLTGGQRDAPPRHQTMRDAIGWSYHLLTEPEQRLFRRLSVFAGGFTLDAADAAFGREDTLDLLSALVEHSLVRHQPGTAGQDRFAQFEVIREYGLERLREHREEAAVRDAHASYFQHLVEALQQRAHDASPGDRREAHVAFHDRLEVELDNLRGALAWLIETQRIEEAMALAVAIWPFRSSRGHDVEARAMLESLLARSAGPVDSLVRADALHAVGNFARTQGDASVSVAALEEAHAIYGGLGDEDRAAQVLVSLGWIAMDLGRLDAALGYYSESLRIARALGDLERVADVRDMLGLLLLQRNEYGPALEHLHDALRVSRIMGNQQRVGNVLNHLGSIALREGDTELASRTFEESVSIARETGDRHLLPSALSHFAEVQHRRGHLELAESMLEESLAVCRETGYLHGVAGSLVELGALAINRGEIATGGRFVLESIVWFDRVGLRYGLQVCAAEGFDALACLALAVGEMPRAVRFLGMADGMFDRVGVPRPAGEPQFVQGKRLGEIRRAAEQPDLRAAWEAGFALDDAAMVAEALAFELPPVREPVADAEPATDHGLSTREREVLRLMADGLTNQEIADALFLSPRTVTSHVTSILGKLGLSTRTAAVSFAIRGGIV